MKKNRTRRPMAAKLQRMEMKMERMAADLRQMAARLNWLQSQINSRNETELDLAIDRLNLFAKIQNQIAREELRAVRERYGLNGETE